LRSCDRSSFPGGFYIVSSRHEGPARDGRLGRGYARPEPAFALRVRRRHVVTARRLRYPRDRTDRCDATLDAPARATMPRARPWILGGPNTWPPLITVRASIKPVPGVSATSIGRLSRDPPDDSVLGSGGDRAASPRPRCDLPDRRCGEYATMA